MKPQHYCHTIRFRGSVHPQGRYQLQILEMSADGEVRYRAQWDFSTLKHVLAFLQKYFPNSQALTSTRQQSLGFENVLSVVGLRELKAA
ncbi:MAG: hypothetical protein NW224_27360 [Leptolyngbyaceae cyanobacterium bins.302]|nr:hypothetical protein [Leptolyngbyaceae cyanobacterium bins.302]